MKKIAFLLICAVLCSFGLREYSKTGSPQGPLALAGNPRPNVVFIVVDTLRADHLPFYGYPEDTAPFLSSLAEKAVVFERAIAASSWTAPAMASIFTASVPSRHGVITGFLASKHMQGDSQKIKLNAIPRATATMGEIMKEAGYKLFGVADNLNIGPEIGFTRGFDKFKTTRNKGADVVNAKIKEWADEIKGTQPYFLYLHYMDPHQPYKRRSPWYKKGRNSKEKTINAYDSEIRYTDEHIKELFQLFGWGDDTIVVFLSDHGEEFWEHGKLGHGRQLYTESIHVPFFVKLPGMAPRRIGGETNVIDVLPTLCAALGIEPRSGWLGRSLLPVMQGGTPEARPIFSELLRAEEHRLPPLRSVIAERRHLIEKEWETGKANSELYNLETDFGERNNLLPAAEADRAKLGKHFDSTGEKKHEQEAPVEIELDRSAIDSLRSLGYLQ